MLVPFLEARIKHSGQMVGLLTCLYSYEHAFPNCWVEHQLAPLIQWFILSYRVIPHSKRLTAAGLFRILTWFPLSRSNERTISLRNTGAKLEKIFQWDKSFKNFFEWKMWGLLYLRGVCGGRAKVAWRLLYSIFREGWGLLYFYGCFFRGKFLMEEGFVVKLS